MVSAFKKFLIQSITCSVLIEGDNVGNVDLFSARHFIIA